MSCDSAGTLLASAHSSSESNGSSFAGGNWTIVLSKNSLTIILTKAIYACGRVCSSKPWKVDNIVYSCMRLCPIDNYDPVTAYYSLLQEI